MNLFDGLQDTAFNVVTTSMGYPASWQPPTGELQTANVLYKDPSQTARLLDQEYDAENCMIEYKRSEFIGLKSLVDSKAEPTILVNGIEYGVMEVNPKFDGNTMIANLKRL